jgi:hypothetical protein
MQRRSSSVFLNVFFSVWMVPPAQGGWVDTMQSASEVSLPTHSDSFRHMHTLAHAGCWATLHV